MIQFSYQYLPDKCFTIFGRWEVEFIASSVILSHEYTLKFLQSSGIKGVHHHTWQGVALFLFLLCISLYYKKKKKQHSHICVIQTQLPSKEWRRAQVLNWAYHRKWCITMVLRTFSLISVGGLNERTRVMPMLWLGSGSAEVSQPAHPFFLPVQHRSDSLKVWSQWE